MPEITLEQVEELERLALAAKEKYPAPWFVVGKDSWRLEGFPQVEMSDEQMSYFPVHDETLGNFCAATDPETVLALVKALREAWGTIALVKQLHSDWKAGALTDGAALVALGLTVSPPKPSEADMEWARRTVRELGLEDEARAALESAMPAPPRTCPRCEVGELFGPDDSGNIACLDCGFVFDMDELWDEDEK